MGRKGFLHILLAVLVVVLIGAAAGYFALNKTQPPTGQQCTAEAKLCPDGSAVGRTGPNCEFAQCPAASPAPTSSTADWKTYRSEKYGFEFKYPYELHISEEDRSVILRDDSDGVPWLGISIDVNPLNLPMAEFYNGIYGPYFPQRAKAVKNVTINGTQGYYFDEREQLNAANDHKLVGESYFVISQGSFFVSIGGPRPEFFDEVLSTFKFFKPKGPTQFDIPILTAGSYNQIGADWKTYRNEKQKFEFRYPPFLKLSESGPGPEPELAEVQLYNYSVPYDEASTENFRIEIANYRIYGLYDIRPTELGKMTIGGNTYRTRGDIYFLIQPNGQTWMRFSHDFDVESQDIRENPAFINEENQRKIVRGILSTFKFTK